MEELTLYLFLSSSKIKLEWLGLIGWGLIGDLEMIFDHLIILAVWRICSSNLEGNFGGPLTISLSEFLKKKKWNGWGLLAGV